MLRALPRELACAEGGLIEFHPRGAIALDHPLHPHEHFGVDRLRAGIAAPQSSGHCGEEKKRKGRDNQEPCQVDEVLGIQDQTKQEKPAILKREEYRRAVTPGQPGQAIKENLRGPDQGPAPAREPTRHRARIDLAANFKERLFDALGLCLVVWGGHHRAAVAGLFDSPQMYAASR